MLPRPSPAPSASRAGPSGCSCGAAPTHGLSRASRADADPAFTDEFEVSGFYIEDVWYPKTSQSWGDRPEPNSLLPLDLVAEEFLPWKRPSKDYPDRDGKFVMVLPMLDDSVGST